ncbi:hypothetical protein LINGRAHAP2_LOCUS14869 [Linum grandiflorum]
MKDYKSMEISSSSSSYPADKNQILLKLKVVDRNDIQVPTPIEEDPCSSEQDIHHHVAAADGDMWATEFCTDALQTLVEEFTSFPVISTPMQAYSYSDDVTNSSQVIKPSLTALVTSLAADETQTQCSPNHHHLVPSENTAAITVSTAAADLHMRELSFTGPRTSLPVTVLLGWIETHQRGQGSNGFHA